MCARVCALLCARPPVCAQGLFVALGGRGPVPGKKEVLSHRQQKQSESPQESSPRSPNYSLTRISCKLREQGGAGRPVPKPCKTAASQTCPGPGSDPPPASPQPHHTLGPSTPGPPRETGGGEGGERSGGSGVGQMPQDGPPRSNSFRCLLKRETQRLGTLSPSRLPGPS